MEINITTPSTFEIEVGNSGNVYSVNGKTGTISVTVDAGVTWTATPNVDWLSVTPTSGRSVGSVTYTIAAYNGVVSRSGSITIAGKTFTVTQTGVDVNLYSAVELAG